MGSALSPQAVPEHVLIPVRLVLPRVAKDSDHRLGHVPERWDMHPKNAPKGGLRTL